MRLHDGGQHFSRHRRDLPGIGDVLEQHDELVAADARNHVVVAHALLEAGRNLDEQQISSRMAQCIVDDLETVEIEKHDGKFPALAPAGLNSFGDRLPEHEAVREPGEIVMGRKETGARLGAALLGDIVKSGDDAAVGQRPMCDRDNAPVGQRRYHRAAREFREQFFLGGSGNFRVLIDSLGQHHDILYGHARYELAGRDPENLRQAPIGDKELQRGIKQA